MFRSSTIIRELALNLAKVIFTLKHSVELRRYLLCGCVAACCHTTAQVAMRQHCHLVALLFLHFQATGRQHRGCITPQAVTHSLVLLKMDEIFTRNMLS